MASVSVRVDGLRELGEAMRKLSNEVATKICRSATASAARVVKKQAIANAPAYPTAHRLEVDGNVVMVPPGNLKKNIVIKRYTKSALTSEHLVTVRGKKKDHYAARYGRLVEFGTVKMAPESYLRLAFDQEKGFAVQKMKSALQRGIAKAGAAGAGRK